jgi:hypothetical protein
MRNPARGPARPRWLAWSLVALAVGVWLTAWGPCAAPWHTACFGRGGAANDWPGYQWWIRYLHSPAWIPSIHAAFPAPLATGGTGPDGVPLAAVLFKPLTRLLGLGNWQYFSLLSLANGLLISGCCLAIGQTRQWRPIATLALGLLLITHPLSWSQLARSQAALQLHGPVLLGLTWLIQRRAALLPWCLLCGASLGLHATTTPMLLAAALVAQLARANQIPGRAGSSDAVRAKVLAVLPRLAALAVAVALAAWLFGIHGGGASGGSEAWGANGLALLDPQGHSAILPALPKRQPFAGEGFAYLGMGLAIALVLCLAQMRDGHPDPWPLLPPLWWGVAGLLVLLALGPTWMIGTTLITPPNALLAVPGLRSFYAVFPRPGPFTWPLSYTLLLWVVDVLARQRRHLLLLTLTGLQLLETSLPMVAKLGQSHQKRLGKEAAQEIVPTPRWHPRPPGPMLGGKRDRAGDA